MTSQSGHLKIHNQVAELQDHPIPLILQKLTLGDCCAGAAQDAASAAARACLWYR
jgi:hypothetical protein